jgi:hypothetical protein
MTRPAISTTLPCQHMHKTHKTSTTGAHFMGFVHALAINLPLPLPSLFIWWWQKSRLLASEHIVSVLSIYTNLTIGFHFTDDSTCTIAVTRCPVISGMCLV